MKILPHPTQLNSKLVKPYFPKKPHHNHTKPTPTFSQLLHNQTRPNSACNLVSTHLEESCQTKKNLTIFFFTQTKFRPNFFLPKTFLEPNFFDQKEFPAQKFWNQKFSDTNFFWPQKKFRPTFFLTRNFFLLHQAVLQSSLKTRKSRAAVHCCSYKHCYNLEPCKTYWTNWNI